MRYDAEHKVRTRERVVKAASRALRSQGPHTLGVAAVMARAGLTHGGFYAHFASREALVAEALDEAFRDAAAAYGRATEGRPPREALGRYLDRYLSPGHRDAAERGCPLPTLAGDLPRLAPDVRARFAEGVARLTARLADLIAATGAPEPASTARSVLAEMVGALSLARATPDAAASDAILAASRRSLRSRLGLEDAA